MTLCTVQPCLFPIFPQSVEFVLQSMFDIQPASQNSKYTIFHMKANQRLSNSTKLWFLSFSGSRHMHLSTSTCIYQHLIVKLGQFQLCQNPLNCSFGCSYGCFALTLHWSCLVLVSQPWLDFALPCLSLSLTLPWTCLDLVLTLSWPYLDIALKLPWPCLNLTLTFPWLFLDVA